MARVTKRSQTSKKIIKVIGIFLLSFILTMIVIFCVKGCVPDVLIEQVLDFSKWEAGALVIIKLGKIWRGEKDV